MAAPGSATERTILSQPDELERLSRTDFDEAASRLKDCRRVHLVGTGTSQHAAELGAAMLWEAGIDALATSAGDFSRFYPTPHPEDGVVLITHTAETAFALSSRAFALELGLPLVSITAQGIGWPEAIETVPKEESETYTVSYTAALLVLAGISAALGAPAEFREDIDRVASAVRDALRSSVTDDIQPPRRALVLAGLGPAAATAREGALKTREASRILAEGYEAEYLLHGSAVPLGPEDHLLLLRPPEDSDGLLTAVGQAAEAEGIGVTTVLEPASLHSLLAQIPLTVRLQLLALRFSRERGQDADTVITGAWTREELWTLGGLSSDPGRTR